MTLEKDGARLSFPDGWQALEWDSAKGFYRRHAAKARSDLRSVDVVAYDPAERTLWLIEIKDYSRSKRADQKPLQEVLAEKAIDSMGSLHAAAKTTVSDSAQAVAARTFVSGAESVRFVYIDMGPAHLSRLFGSGISMVDLSLALRQRIRCIDAHPRVADTRDWPSALPWSAVKL